MSWLKHGKKQNEKFDSSNDDLARAAFGMDEESILKECEEIEERLREGREDPELHIGQEEINTGWQQLTTEMTRRGLGFEDEAVAVESTAQITPENESSQKRRGGMRGMLHSKKFHKIALVTVVLMIGMVGSAMTAAGQKQLRVRGAIRQGDKIVWNDGDTRQDDGKLQQAYEKIEKELGIRPLQLIYMPQGMVFEQLMTLDETSVKLIFTYQGEKIFFEQSHRDSKQLLKAVTADTVEETIAKNMWMKLEIPVYSHCLEDGRTEYQADIVYIDAMYSLCAIMEREEFIKMVERLAFLGEVENMQ